MAEMEKDLRELPALIELQARLREHKAAGKPDPFSDDNVAALMFGPPAHIQAHLEANHPNYGPPAPGDRSSRTPGRKSGGGADGGLALEGSDQIRFRGKMTAESADAIEEKRAKQKMIEKLRGSCSCPWPCPGPVPHDGACNCAPRVAKCGFCMNGCLAAIEGFSATDSCYQMVLGAKGFVSRNDMEYGGGRAGSRCRRCSGERADGSSFLVSQLAHFATR